MYRTHAAVLAAFLLACLATPAISIVIHVPGDQPTIQEGVNAAGKGDTVLVAAGTYSGEFNRNIDFGGVNTVLRGASGPEATVIDGLDGARAFHLHSGEDSTSVIEGLTIRSGRTDDCGGGLLCDGASVKILGCIFEGNWTGDRGGAAAFFASSSVIANTVFYGNTSEYALYGEGGAVYCTDGSALMVRDCVFRSNSSDIGGALACTGSSVAGIVRCLCWGNAADSGGAFACRGSSSMTIEHCTMSGNISVSGVGIYSSGGSSVEAAASIIAFGSKGTAAMCVYGGTIALSCCDVYENEYGDWVGCIADQNGVNGNFSGDPLYCWFISTPDRRFSLHADSPCAPEHSGGCGLVGAFGVGCQSTVVEEASWGTIKAMYR